MGSLSSPALPPELAGYGVVYFGNDWFAENRTSSHHIARRLSQVLPVLYIETPGIRAPQTTARDLRKLWKKLSIVCFDTLNSGKTG